jgi:hypothetical protein
MTKNPLINALAAGLYIAAIATFMSYGEGLFEGPDNLFMPMLMLSLLVLSVSVMAVLFFYQPVRLYLDGEKVAAFKFLMTTIATFAVITVGFFFTAVLLS